MVVSGLELRFFLSKIYRPALGDRVMLLAFRRSRVVPGSEKLEKWLLDHGIRPLIAHPECNRQIMRDALLLETFLDLGCRLQVTAGTEQRDLCQVLLR